VTLAEIDGEDVIVRVQATPDRANDGARLADEVIDALATVTGEHEVVQDGNGQAQPETGAASRRETGAAARRD
jgi:hypothetical protein